MICTSDARGAVEKWLLQVQDVMLLSVRDVVAAAREVSLLIERAPQYGVRCNRSSWPDKPRKLETNQLDALAS